MKLSQLRYFCEVCRCNSVSKAAKKLFISQPAVSMAIRELEDELGCCLFFRTHNRLTPTAEGARLLEDAKEVLELVSKFPEHMQSLTHQAITIRLGLPPVTSAFFVPALTKIIKEFRKNRPDAKIELMEYRHTEDMVDFMEKGKLDFAISTTDKARFSQHKKEMIYKSPLMVCVGPTHRLAGKQEVEIEELADEPLIRAFHSSSVVDCAVNDMFDSAGMKPNYRFLFTQERVIKQLLMEGEVLLITRPEMMNFDEEIRHIPLKKLVEIPVHILWRADRLITSDEAVFIEMIRQTNFK